MGLTGGLYEVPRDVFEQYVAGDEPQHPDMKLYELDKAWYEFHIVLRKKGPPLSHAITGDYPHPHCPHSLDELSTGDFDCYFGFASPSLVHEIADVLAETKQSDYQRWASAVIGDRDFDQVFFGNLKSAYIEADSRNNALMIVVD